ncbi:DUF255 domain-containing protein [Pseudomonadota bacterium]
MHKLPLILVSAVFLLSLDSRAFEHKDSDVQFLEYSRDVIADNKNQKRPYFLLFSAQWCHWCAVFNERTLHEKKVSDFLNSNFVNVFVDTDINGGAYKKYKARGWPYVVFLNPDGSIYYKYSGTLYADDFLQVIKEISVNAKNGRSVFENDSASIKYEPPQKIDLEALKTSGREFRQAVLENFDSKEFGVGRGEKAVLPRTFLYLLSSSDRKLREEAYQFIAGTMQSAIAHIYDPVEGGFYRYAEKRDWQIPHFEKMADLNAGSVLLLYKLHKRLGDPSFKQVAGQTLKYITSRLYNNDIGSFMSFQEADTSYYFLNESRRKKAQQPPMAEKIFIDRLANTLDYLIDTLEYTSEFDLQSKIRSSLDFAGKMILAEDKVKHYYSIADKRWMKDGGLSDNAVLSRVFLKAASVFKSKNYQEIADKIIIDVQQKYFVRNKKIFFDELAGDFDDIESLIEINGLLALSLMHPTQSAKSQSSKVTDDLMTYFSKANELIEDRTWDAREWWFAESYVPYMAAADKYLAK